VHLVADHEVTVLDSLRYGPWRFDPDCAAMLDLQAGDIRDAAFVAESMRRASPEAVIHLAAIHFIPECEEEPLLAVSTNVDGTLNLLSHCPRDARFVTASSGAVYLPSDDPHDEEASSVGPTDIYGMTKLHCEHYAGYLARERNLKVVLVRLFNVVGPGETNPHVLPEIVAQLKGGYDVLRLGNLTPKRDFIHVTDAARGFATVATAGDVRPGATEIVNLGTGCQYSVAELLEMLSGIAGQKFTIDRDSKRLRKVDRPFLCADISRIRDRFGWSPERTLEDALRDIWADPDIPQSLLDKYRSKTLR
jgi:UDP-glucose 4-epimerase